MSTKARFLVPVTIANGASLSAEVNLNGYEVEAIHMPASWTAADITFAAATVSGGTFDPVHDDAGTEVTVTAAASRAIPIGTVTKRLRGLNYIKVRSGTVGVAVNQGAERIVTLSLKAKG